MGPTATGKTEAALALAESLNAEIVSVDSMVVYRGMDIGTAKPTAAQRARVPHHLIDLVEPSEPFSVARYQALGRAGARRASRRAGTARPADAAARASYFRALVDDLEFPGTDPRDPRGPRATRPRAVGAARSTDVSAEFDPVAAAKIEPANVRRTVRALEVRGRDGPAVQRLRADAGTATRPTASGRPGLELPRERPGASGSTPASTRMLDGGLAGGGARAWSSAGSARGSPRPRPSATLSWPVTCRDASSLEEAVELTVERTRNLARRQMAWFRRDPRIRWFAVGPEGPEAVLGDVRAYLTSEPAS